MSIERALGIVLFIIVIILLLHLAGHAQANEGWGEHRGWEHHQHGGWFGNSVLPFAAPYPYYRQPRPMTVCSYDYYGRPYNCHVEY
jgi:hypothetical protein